MMWDIFPFCQLYTKFTFKESKLLSQVQTAKLKMQQHKTIVLTPIPFNFTAWKSNMYIITNS